MEVFYDAPTLSGGPLGDASGSASSISVPIHDPATPRPPSKKKAKRSREQDYLLSWAVGTDMTSWANSKVSAAREAKRLKDKRKREDERRAVKLFSSLDASERDEFLEELGEDDIVFRKLFSQSDSSTMDDIPDEEMHEL